MKRLWKILLAVFSGLILLVGGYAVYVFSAYYRLEDNLPLTVEGEDSGIRAEAGQPLRVIIGHHPHAVKRNVLQRAAELLARSVNRRQEEKP